MNLPKDERTLASFKSTLEFHRKRIAKLRETTELPSPWEKYPTYTYGCIGWRMGAGEDFMENWRDWYGSLSPEHRAGYREHHPEPLEWAGFYDKHNYEYRSPDAHWAFVLSRYEDQVRRYEEYLRGN